MDPRSPHRGGVHLLAATFAGLPQGPTVGYILVALIVVAFVQGRVYGSGELTHPNREGDKSVESVDPPDLKNRD